MLMYSTSSRYSAALLSETPLRACVWGSEEAPFPARPSKHCSSFFSFLLLAAFSLAMSHLRKVSSDTNPTLPRRSSLLALGSDEQRRQHAQIRFDRIATIQHEAEGSPIRIPRPDYHYYVKPAFAEALKLADEASRADPRDNPISLCRSAVICSFEKAVKDLGAEMDLGEFLLLLLELARS